MGEKEEITLRLETFNNNEYILADDCINAIGEHRKEIERLNNIIEQLVDIIVDSLNVETVEKALNISIDDFRIWVKEKLKGEDK